MDKAEVERNLGMVGKANFVTFYEQLSDFSQTDQVVAEFIATKLERTYESTLTFRVRPSRKIIRAGASGTAMSIIICSGVPNRIKQLAEEMSKALKEGE